MSHRIKNLFTIAGSMVRMTARHSASKEELEENLAGRLLALSQANSLVHRSFGDDSLGKVNFGELLERVLKPHGYENCVIDGPRFAISEQATNHLALVFHELATNAAKYRALSSDKGALAVTWSIDDEKVRVIWQETGGPATAPPTRAGFGSQLVETTIGQLGGHINYD